MDRFLFRNFYQFKVSLSPFTLSFLPDIPYPLFPASTCKKYNANFSVNRWGKHVKLFLFFVFSELEARCTKICKDTYVCLTVFARTYLENLTCH